MAAQLQDVDNYLLQKYRVLNFPITIGGKDGTIQGAVLVDSTGNEVTSLNPVPTQEVDPTWNTPTHTSVDVPATTSTTALAANANRILAVVTNNTGTKMFLKFGATSDTDGLPLASVGSSITVSGDSYTGAISVYHEGTGIKKVKVLEVT